MVSRGFKLATSMLNYIEFSIEIFYVTCYLSKTKYEKWHYKKEKVMYKGLSHNAYFYCLGIAQAQAFFGM